MELVFNNCEHEDFIHQHLYIVSDEEIKLFDWIYNIKENIIEQITSKVSLTFVLEENKENQTFKKIIATTDTSLGIPQPSQGFIEKYIKEYNKGNIITDILVEYETVFLPIDAYPSQQKHVKQLKASKGNTITIHPIKDSWTREEVEELCRKSFKEGLKYLYMKDINDIENKWIKEIL